MHRSRSNWKTPQNLELRLGPSSPPKAGILNSNSVRGFPDLITIEADDDSEMFSERPSVEALRLFPCPSASASVISDEDLELRLGPKDNGLAGNHSNGRNISYDRMEDTSHTWKSFKGTKFGQSWSSHPFLEEKEVKLRCTVCMDTMKEETSTICGHIFCMSCILSVIHFQRKCPTCRYTLNFGNIHRIYLPGANS